MKRRDFLKTALAASAAVAEPLNPDGSLTIKKNNR